MGLGGFIDSFNVLHELVLGLAAEELARGRRGRGAGEGSAEGGGDGVHVAVRIVIILLRHMVKIR